MSQNQKEEVSLELPSMLFPLRGKLSTPKKGQLSHCTVMQNLWLCWTACSQPKSIRIWAPAAVPGHLEKHACGIAAGGREGSSVQVDSPTELWQSGGTSLVLNDTCEIYHQSLEQNGSIQSVFTMPLLSLYLTEEVNYSTVSRSAPALVDTLSCFAANSLLKGAVLVHLQRVTFSFLCVMYFFFILLYVLWFLQWSMYVLLMVEKRCVRILGISNIFQ